MNTHIGGNGSRKVVPEFLFLSDGSPIPLASNKPNGKHSGPPAIDATTKETREVASAQLEDGGNVEVVEDPCDSTRTRLAVSRNGVVDFVDSVQDRGRLLIPLKKEDSILREVRLPRGVQPYESPAWLAHEVGRLINTVVPIPLGLQRILGAFTVHTWIGDHLPLSPGIIIRGPLEISSPLLQALALVCRRAVVVGDANSAGVLKACSRVQPTLLVVNFRLRPAVLRILGMGMRRGVQVLQKAGAQSPFGPKLIATNKLPSDLCIPGDCLLLSIGQSSSSDVAKLLDRQINERADHLQECLLQLRFDLSSSVRPLGNELSKPFAFRGKDWVRCLGAPFAGDGQFVADLHEAVSSHCAVLPNRARVLERTIVSALFFLAHEEEHQQGLLVGELAKLADELLEERGEEITLSPRKVGAILTELGFPDRPRTGHGCELLLDRSIQELIHMLASDYRAFEVVRYSRGGIPGYHCELCRQFKLVSEEAIRHYNEVEKPLIEQKKREAKAKRIVRLQKRPPYDILGRPRKVDGPTEGKKEKSSDRS